MALVSSQGTVWGSVTGVTGISVKTSSAADDPSKNLVDVSTLGIAHKGDRVYAAAPVTDIAAGGKNGMNVTATITYFTDTPPVEGDIVVGGGLNLVCMEVNEETKVGEYTTGSATYMSNGTV